MQVSDYKKTPIGTLVRQWIAPIVIAEIKNIPVKQKQIEYIDLLDGRKLTKDSSYQELTSVFEDTQEGKIKLSAQEYANLIGWIVTAGKKLFRAAS